ncbi:conjugal transfer protein TraD [Flavobacterium sp. 17A]|uniref:Conjugal transfer protein TraD n=1 Tax=Flavobacterium potami TaxID=2872310 RepID=A0A9X1KRN1_9FLAO|nr:conjugal transfer protein TraD [Flavobacterium potami]MBZ4036730.1 conjugal transfer protein TraD [Flavobacterium potami]
MEIIIVICLLIVIFLLAQDKIVIKRKQEPASADEKVNPALPDIIGQPRKVERLSVSNTVSERQIKEPEINPGNLDIEYDENESAAIQVPQEELDEVFSNMPDFDEEEEEWNGYGISGSEYGFAQGVTFEELNAVGMMLQKDKLEPSQKQSAAAIVQKIQGTELFSLLENSIESASSKIAELLDQSLSSDYDTGSSNLRKNDLSNFDIGEFL